MFPFDSPENIRKSKGFMKVFLMFSGGSKGNIGKTFFRREEITPNPLNKSSHLRCSVGEGVLEVLQNLQAQSLFY